MLVSPVVVVSPPVLVVVSPPVVEAPSVVSVPVPVPVVSGPMLVLVLLVWLSLVSTGLVVWVSSLVPVMPSVVRSTVVAASVTPSLLPLTVESVALLLTLPWVVVVGLVFELAVAEPSVSPVEPSEAAPVPSAGVLEHPRLSAPRIVKV